MLYAIIALILRAILAYMLYPRARLVLDAGTRNATTVLYLASFISVLLGFYVYLMTLILLIYLGYQLWEKRKRRVSLKKDLPLFVLTLILFFNGPGQFSLDRWVAPF